MNACLRSWEVDPGLGRRFSRRSKTTEGLVSRRRDNSHVRNRGVAENQELRIISDDLWERAQHRMRPAKDDARLKAGGRPKYLLSGLLRCDVCDAHYTITDAVSYGCSSYHDGRACSNSIRVRRDRVETILLGQIRDDLLGPERIERMAREMGEYYRERVRALQTHAAEVPGELQELAARLQRLHERLKRGDPDMTADELQAAIDRAEAKRREIQEQQNGATWSAKALDHVSRRRAVPPPSGAGPRRPSRRDPRHACSCARGSAARSTWSGCLTAGPWPIGIRTLARSARA